MKHVNHRIIDSGIIEEMLVKFNALKGYLKKDKSLDYIDGHFENEIKEIECLSNKLVDLDSFEMFISGKRKEVEAEEEDVFEEYVCEIKFLQGIRYAIKIDMSNVENHLSVELKDLLDLYIKINKEIAILFDKQEELNNNDNYLKEELCH